MLTNKKKGSRAITHCSFIPSFIARLVVLVVVAFVLERKHRNAARGSEAAGASSLCSSTSNSSVPPPPAPAGSKDRDRPVEARRGQGRARRVPADVPDRIQLPKAVVLVVGRCVSVLFLFFVSSLFSFLFFAPARPRRGPVGDAQASRQRPHQLPRGEVPDADATVLVFGFWRRKREKESEFQFFLGRRRRLSCAWAVSPTSLSLSSPFLFSLDFLLLSLGARKEKELTRRCCR